MLRVRTAIAHAFEGALSDEDTGVRSARTSRKTSLRDSGRGDQLRLQ